MKDKKKPDRTGVSRVDQDVLCLFALHESGDFGSKVGEVLGIPSLPRSCTDRRWYFPDVGGAGRNLLGDPGPCDRQGLHGEAT